MKNSNKIITLAAVIVLASLTAYNFALKAEYKKGSYNDPFNNYQRYSFGEFTEIEIKGGNALEVEIVANGKSDIRVHNGLKDNIKVEQLGKKLLIRIKDSTRFVSGYPQGIVVSAKYLKGIKVDGQAYTYINRRGEKVSEMRGDGVVVLKNFELDSLSIELGATSKIKLQKNAIQVLQATVGSTTKKGSVLDVGESNKVGTASFTVNNESSLRLSNPKINKLNYTLADSAEVTLKGSSLSLLKK